MKYLNILVLILVVIGCINWGCIGLFNMNLVTMLFGNSLLTRIIYILVGLSGLYAISFYKRINME